MNILKIKEWLQEVKERAYVKKEDWSEYWYDLNCYDSEGNSYIILCTWEGGFDESKFEGGYVLCVSVRKLEKGIIYPFKADAPNPFEDDFAITPNETEQSIEGTIVYLEQLIKGAVLI